jgi:hypothetical protein
LNCTNASLSAKYIDRISWLAVCTLATGFQITPKEKNNMGTALSLSEQPTAKIAIHPFHVNVPETELTELHGLQIAAVGFFTRDEEMRHA